MKKIVLVLLCVILLLPLIGCKDNMDGLFPQIDNPDWAKTGVTSKEMLALLKENGFEAGSIDNYYSVGKKDGQLLVTRNQLGKIDAGETVYTTVEIRTYAVTQSAPDENFAKIEKGMDLFQVVELVGDVPLTVSNTKGTYLEDSQGRGYSIQWRFDENLQKAIVNSLTVYH